jgi:hypothetical protein
MKFAVLRRNVETAAVISDILGLPPETMWSKMRVRMAQDRTASVRIDLPLSKEQLRRLVDAHVEMGS